MRMILLMLILVASVSTVANAQDRESDCYDQDNPILNGQAQIKSQLDDQEKMLEKSEREREYQQQQRESEQLQENTRTMRNDIDELNRDIEVPDLGKLP